MTEEQKNKNKCTVTFETAYGDKAIISITPGEEVGQLTFVMNMVPPNPKKYQNLTGDLINQFLNMLNNGEDPVPFTTGPGGEA